MNQFSPTRSMRLLAPLLPLLLLAAVAVAFEPLAFLLAGPWLLALLWVVTRRGPDVEVATEPSMAESARRRLAVR